jgi:hypothetical protein
MQYGITIKHRNHAFVEQHGGWEFLSHLRAGPSRAAYRRRALLHAMQAYRRILAAGGVPEELCGAALLVLQRAAFCAEDLAGLLHALSDTTDRWMRLTSPQIPHLDAVYRQVAKDARAWGPVRARPSLKAFCIGPDELIERESGLSAERRAASVHLAELYAARWLKRMRPVALFWIQYRELAKATMHGYPLLAGRRVVGPPPAGWLAEAVSDPGVPFAVVLSTQVHKPQDPGTKPGHLETLVTVLRCNPPAIEDVHRAGRHAIDVYEDLCNQQATSIQTTAAVTIPAAFAHRLPAAERAAFMETIQQ